MIFVTQNNGISYAVYKGICRCKWSYLWVLSRITYRVFYVYSSFLYSPEKTRIFLSSEFFMIRARRIRRITGRMLLLVRVCILIRLYYKCTQSNNSIWKPQQITNKWHQKPMNHILWKFLYFFHNISACLALGWFIYFYILFFFSCKMRSKAGNFALFLAVFFLSRSSSIYQANT